MDQSLGGLAKEGPTEIKIKGTSHRRDNQFAFAFKPNDFWFTKVRKSVFTL